MSELTENKLYAIKESHNLAMLSAATSVSALLNGSVWIKDASASVHRIMDFIYPEVSPSVFVKITYTGGFDGTAILIFKQDDVQLMLAQLMGMPLEINPEFVFDEINTSAFGEIMNQMMSSYLTELSGLIGNSLVITEAEVLSNAASQQVHTVMGLNPDDNICAVKSSLKVDSNIDNYFLTVLSETLAQEISDKTEERFPMPEPAAAEPAAEETGFPDLSTAPDQMSAAFDTSNSDDSSIFSMSPNDGPSAFDSPMDSSLSSFGGYSGTPAAFSSFDSAPTQEELNNLKLLMNVPLELSIEIGSTKRKVDDILQFSHGTIIELDSPADAPVNVIVNGHLIARGDVVVVDDYFAVRVTEIIQSNIDNLSIGE